MRRAALLTPLVLGLAACQGHGSGSAPTAALTVATSATPPPMAVTLASRINDEDFLRFDQELASNAFEGRKPGTRGEVLTTRYLVRELEHMHLKPGNHGSWFQPVPVVSTRLLNTNVRLEVTLPHGVTTFANGADMVVGTQRATPLVDLRDSPIVFMGYGIDAPRWQWNDYRNVDVRGKTVIVLSNDPGYPSGNPQLFNGRAMSRYGRRAYKYRQAALMGAAACFIIHSTPASGFPWTAVLNAHRGSQQALPTSAAPGPRLAVAGILTHAAAEKLFRAAGVDLDTLAAEAAQPGFQPVSLNARASILLRSAVSYSWSDNVLALLPGSRHPDQVVIYSAHWDGLGVERDARGRPEVLHGAIENGSGVAALLEIADTFAHRKRPARSVLFLLPTLGTADQAGSRWYVAHPVFPLDDTVADINLDAWPVLGRARDMTVFGAGQSQLEDGLRRMLALQGRTPSPDAAPQNGMYYRSDQYSFARVGVPALLAGPGLDLVEGGDRAGEAAFQDYLLHRYRSAADVFDPHWDLSGTLEDIQTLFQLGQNLANSDQWPNWSEDNPHRKLRDAQMARRIARARALSARPAPAPPAPRAPQPAAPRSRAHLPARPAASQAAPPRAP